MQKLIEIKKDTHYIVVDDSEIKEGDLCYDKEGNPGYNNIQYVVKCLRTAYDSYWNKNCKKITHSFGVKLEGVINRPLSEVEEAIGYSVEKMANEWFLINQYNQEDMIHSHRVPEYITTKNLWKKGFNAHKKLVEKKLFTVEDMKLCYMQGWNRGRDNCSTEMNNYIQSLLPKNEWEIKEITPEGKLKLI